MSVWVGTYREKGGRGLYPLDPAGRALSLGAPEPKIANASYAAWSPDRRTAYFVDEQDEGTISAWRRGGDRWLPVGESSSGGALPCYLSLHPSGAWLAVANYGDGTVALVRLDPASGALLEIADTRRQAGRGPDSERQDGPHAHCALFDPTEEWLYHVDLGLDRVFRYALGEDGLGAAEVAFEARPGSGPRHLAWHPDGRHALLICELSAELVLLEVAPGGLTALDTVETSDGANPDNLGGHLAVCATGRVLVTNRGDDTLVEFAVQRGRLRRVAARPTGGASPRHFARVPAGILVAHEESGTVSLLGDDGSMTSVAVPGAAFVFVG